MGEAYGFLRRRMAEKVALQIGHCFFDFLVRGRVYPHPFTYAFQAEFVSALFSIGLSRQTRTLFSTSDRQIEHRASSRPSFSVYLTILT